MNGANFSISTVLLLAATCFLMAARLDPLRSFRTLMAEVTISATGGCDIGFLGLAVFVLDAVLDAALAGVACASDMLR